MIYINKEPVKIIHYPDGTQKIDLPFRPLHKHLQITWRYESEEELSTLIYVVYHLKNTYSYGELSLYMPYLPNARMDRIHDKTEVFTLKSFAEIINFLDFHMVQSLDVHSNVSEALINHFTNLSPRDYIINVIRSFPELYKNIILYYPDNGAAKKYSAMLPESKYCYGIKNRDWLTGKILGLNIVDNGIALEGRTVLMVDDIISYGGSLYYSAKALKEAGAGDIYAYATHTENSILNKEKGTLIKALEDGTVQRLFTTNSILTGEHEKISVEDVL